jgi:hypothetical protein
LDPVAKDNFVESSSNRYEAFRTNYESSKNVVAAVEVKQPKVVPNDPFKEFAASTFDELNRNIGNNRKNISKTQKSQEFSNMLFNEKISTSSTFTSSSAKVFLHKFPNFCLCCPCDCLD